MGLLSRISNFFGRGDEDTLSVPPMDGVFKPNTRLDSAERLLAMPGIDNLAVADGALYCSSGNALYRIDLKSGTATPIKQFEGPVTMITASPAGRIAVAAEGAGLQVLDPNGDVYTLSLPAENVSCITAAVFRDEDTILFSIGTQKHALSDWKRDLMNHGATGLIASHKLSTGSTAVIRDRLAFPYGITVTANTTIAVSESWRHRVVAIDTQRGGAAMAVLPDLPAYPARLVPASDGGHWLALFAPRRQLTELVLREDDYRHEMMETIPPEDWIGPDFGEGGSEEQPLQSGSVRQMGIMKPWAPSRSYGMIVRLDRDMTPVASYHSRADGKMHGIASVVEWDGALYAASKGSGTLIRLDLAAEALK
jgi:hypothetical protein